MSFKGMSRLADRREGFAVAAVVRLGPILRQGRAIETETAPRWQFACRGAQRS